MNKLIIVGIDPGKTVGYAILDLGGNLLNINSEKLITLNDIISKVISIGEPIIVGTDKKIPPYFVSRFATKVGARIISPKNDLSINEKRVSSNPYKTNNYHELDALASALYAYNQLKTLIERIESFIRIYDKEHMRKSLFKMVILNGINIKTAAEEIDKKEQKIKIITSKINKNVVSKSNELEKLKLRINSYIRDIDTLKGYNQKLLGEIQRLEIKIKNFTTISQEEIDKKLNRKKYFYEQRINILQRQLDERDKVIYGLKNSIDKLNLMLAETRDNLLIKKLPNLSYRLYELYNKVLNIQEGDIIFVNNPNIINPLTIEMIKNKVAVIIYNINPIKSVTKLPFIFISSKELKILETDFFGSINNHDFERRFKEHNLLTRVVENYRKNRIGLGIISRS